MPGGRFPAPFPGAAPIVHGETSNLEAYQRAIARAEDYIYIEDQYFTNNAIVDALIIRMQQVPTLQLIMVLNINADDFPGYARKQIRNIKLIQKKVSNHEQRFKVFTLWATQFSTDPERAKKPFEIMNIYVHSKVAIVDDKWATIGTANLDGSGLNAVEISDITKAAILKNLPTAAVVLIDIILLGLVLLLAPLALVIAAGILGVVALIIAGVALVTADDSGEIPDLLKEAIKSIQLTTQHANPLQATQPARHLELNVVLYNGVAGQPPTEAIKKFREELWSEHLGISGAFPAKPADGWLKLWTDAAQEKIDNVKDFALSVPGTTGPVKATAIEWKPETDAKKYLKAHSLDVRDQKVRLTIRNKADEFNFLTGQWEKNKF
jgi:PLD-like domain